MTTTIRETISYNNVGVALLELGSIHEARELFGLAIEGMKGVLDTKMQSTPASSSRQTADAEAHVSCSLSAVVNHNNGIPPPPSTTTASAAHHHHHNPQLGSQPLHAAAVPSTSNTRPTTIPTTTTSTATSTPDPIAATAAAVDTSSSSSSSTRFYEFLRPVYISEDEYLLNNTPLVKLTISLLFNLAISDHAIAMMSTTSSSSKSSPAVAAASSSSPPQDEHDATCNSTATVTTAANAIFLYQLAYCLQIEDGIELSRIHTMGMINNVGRLLAFLGDTKESENCFRHLLKKLMVQVVEEPHRVQRGARAEREERQRRSSSSRTTTTTTTMSGGGVETYTANDMDVSPDHDTTATTTSSTTNHNNNNNNNNSTKNKVDDEVEQIEGFLDNIMHVILRHTLSSAAA